MEVTFAKAMDKGKVLKLGDLNAGFTKPDTIALAYYEASLLVDHIVKGHGQEGLNALVRSYGDGIETEAALKKTAVRLIAVIVAGRSADVLQSRAGRAVRRHPARHSRRRHAD